MMGSIDFPLAAPVFALVGVIVLARFAYRGRRVDDHPLCRRCGFDLTGRPPESRVCAECGADLSAARAVRVGHRRPRRRPLAVAVVVGLLAAAWLGVGVYGRAANVDWLRHAPAWWVIRQAQDHRDLAARDAALAELHRRILGGTLGRPRVDEAADLGLAHQADRSAAWVPGWGAVVEVARATGKLSADRWDRYRLQAAPVSFDVRPTVRRGDPLAYVLRDAPARLATAQFYQGVSVGRSWHRPSDPPDDAATAALTIDGKPVPEYRDFGTSSGTIASYYGGGSSAGTIDLPARLLNELADGPHAVVLALRRAVAPGPRTGDPADDPEGVSVVDELQATFTLVPADRPTVTLTRDPSLRPAIEAALTVREATQDLRSESPPGYLSVTLNNTGTPVGLAFKVGVRPAGTPPGTKTWSLGTIHFDPVPPGTRSNAAYVTGASGPRLAGFDARRIDVVLKPSPEAAVRTIHLARIWDGEVVIKGVLVKQLVTPYTSLAPLSGPGRSSVVPMPIVPEEP